MDEKQNPTRQKANAAKSPTAKTKAKTTKSANALAAKRPEGDKRERTLTFQQRVFVAEYIKDRNGTQAAIRAGYKPKAAQEQASRLLSNAMVKAEIEALITVVSERAELTAEKTLRELARLVFFDPRRLLNTDGSPKPLHELDDDTAACLAGLEVLESYEGSGEDRKFVGIVKKYKIADKNSALEKAMKHLGLFEKNNRQLTDPLTTLFEKVAGTALKPKD